MKNTSYLYFYYLYIGRQKKWLNLVIFANSNEPSTMIEAHFENIRNLISGKIKEAKSDIKIAVAWFTQKEMFSKLLGALFHYS